MSAGAGLILIRGSGATPDRMWTRGDYAVVWRHIYGGWSLEVSYWLSQESWVIHFNRNGKAIGDLEFVKDDRFEGMSQDERMDLVLYKAGIVFDHIQAIWTEFIND